MPSPAYITFEDFHWYQALKSRVTPLGPVCASHSSYYSHGTKSRMKVALEGEPQLLKDKMHFENKA
jgi:hypothetical protein